MLFTIFSPARILNHDIPKRPTYYAPPLPISNADDGVSYRHRYRPWLAGKNTNSIYNDALTAKNMTRIPGYSSVS